MGWMSLELMGFCSDGGMLGDGRYLELGLMLEKQGRVFRRGRWLKSEDRRILGVEKFLDVLRGMGGVDYIQLEGQLKIE